MPIGAITGYIDVAQVVLYVFWGCFAALIYYLLSEGKREGYPLESDRTRRTDRMVVQGYPRVPKAKVYRLADGREVHAPGAVPDTRELKAEPVAAWPGAPFRPTGDPMLAEVGPGAWAERAEVPDATFDGQPRLVPLRADPDYQVAAEDPNPVGMPVIAGDGVEAGTIAEVWIDRAESVIRYYEVVLPGDPARVVMLPAGFARVDRSARAVHVRSIFAARFAQVPQLAARDVITLREEERVMAFYGAGTLYATPRREESIF